MIGSTAISLIGQFKVDYAIIGASAIDEEGALLDFDYREVQVAQAIIANARSVMLVADSTKLRRSAPVRIAHIGQIQTFVTDRALPAGLAQHLPDPRHRGDRGDAGGDDLDAGPEPPTAERVRTRVSASLCPADRLAARRAAQFAHFRVAFDLRCDLIENESEIAKVNGERRGSVCWTGFSTSRSSAAASTAAASRATRPAAAIRFSSVK